MAKAFINLSLFVMFACCAIPAQAIENSPLVKQTPEVTTSQEEQNLPDIQALKADYTKLFFAGCLFTSIALVITLHKLAPTKDELTLYKAVHTAQTLIKLEANDKTMLQITSPAESTFTKTALDFITQAQIAFTEMFKNFNPSNAYITL